MLHETILFLIPLSSQSIYRRSFSFSVYLDTPPCILRGFQNMCHWFDFSHLKFNYYLPISWHTIERECGKFRCNCHLGIPHADWQCHTGTMQRLLASFLALLLVKQCGRSRQVLSEQKISRSTMLRSRQTQQLNGMSSMYAEDKQTKLIKTCLGIGE